VAEEITTLEQFYDLPVKPHRAGTGLVAQVMKCPQSGCDQHTISSRKRSPKDPRPQCSVHNVPLKWAGNAYEGRDSQLFRDK